MFCSVYLLFIGHLRPLLVFLFFCTANINCISLDSDSLYYCTLLHTSLFHHFNLQYKLLYTNSVSSLSLFFKYSTSHDEWWDIVSKVIVHSFSRRWSSRNSPSSVLVQLFKNRADLHWVSHSQRENCSWLSTLLSFISADVAPCIHYILSPKRWVIQQAFYTVDNLN